MIVFMLHQEVGVCKAVEKLEMWGYLSPLSFMEDS